MGEMSTIGALSGHLARPSAPGPWPALIVIQEWWGQDRQTKSIADRFAREGYLAFSPDVFHGELAQLGDVAKASQLAGKYSAGAPAKLQAAFEALKADRNTSGKIGAVGFCFGGRMALALRAPLDAVCTFYGGGMQQLFDQLDRLKCPVLGLFGDQDMSIPFGTVEEFDRRLDQVGVEHEVKVYPKSGHAFFRDTDPNSYRSAAAQDAWRKATEFFARHLKR